jgi:uncharacterized protein
MSKYAEFNELIDTDGVFYLKDDTEPYSGQVKGNYSGCMINGLPSGVWEEYSNGVLISKSTYNKGGLEGLLINYYSNGSIKEIGYVKNNKWIGKHKEYYDNGIIREEKNYLDGKLEGYALLYFKNGKIKESKFYKSDKLNKEFLYYYNNGQLWIKSNYQNGKLNGDRFIYYKDGSLEKKETYKDGINIFNKMH